MQTILNELVDDTRANWRLLSGNTQEQPGVVENGKTVIPGVFRAAGLMVPEPSIKSPPPPIPFTELDTECVVEYMTSN